MLYNLINWCKFSKDSDIFSINLFLFLYNILQDKLSDISIGISRIYQCKLHTDHKHRYKFSKAIGMINIALSRERYLYYM